RSVTVAGDGIADLDTFSRTEVIAGGGIEYLLADAYPLRLGYRSDTGRDTHSVSGGIGYVNKVVSLDLSIRQDVHGLDETWLLFGIRFHIE
ncbi:MAG: hypothetical protein ACPGUV_02900, partial [Polyangiales bacterium]